MSEWIDGNIPKDINSFYWLAIKKADKNITYSVPCKYNHERKCWIDTDNNMLSVHTVVAYCPILKPKSYSTLGSGCGYYIRTIQKNNEIIYGFGLQPVDWVRKGYNTIEKAKAATKRLRKLDLNDGYERDLYEILNSNSEVVWKLI